MPATAPTVTIRSARKEDCPRLLELIQELADYERASGEVTVSLPHFEESGFGENRVWWAHVASVPQTSSEESLPLTPSEGGEAETIVGFALYYVRYSTWKGQRMYLEDIIVTKKWRCKGIGSKLMDALIEEAKQKHFSGIMWQVLEWNEPAIKFYERYQPKFDGEWVNVSIEISVKE
ncbi:MAG TPA: GNAT family N-acetyltransferase [Flavipsychrobacter sp.]|nr:GNAT family N-acetyltransferase [Flavipsychrobacter sp.]